MNSEVLFENKDFKLVVSLNKDAEYADIKNKITSILNVTPNMFDDIVEPISVKGKRLADNEEADLLKLFSLYTLKKVVIEKPKRLGVATIGSIFSKDVTVSTAKLFTGTVRSGQRIEYEGTIILLGDVNAGSEVVAEQNIIVVGDIRGHVHAGAKGNRACYIAANKINATQLRIADLIYKSDSKVEIGNNYEIARIKMGEINIEH